MPTPSMRSWCWAGLKHAAVFLIAAAAVPCVGAAAEGGAAAAGSQQTGAVAVIPVAGPLTAAPRFKERLLLVDINRQQLDQAVLVLEDKTGALYLWSQDLERWRLRLPDPKFALIHQGQTYFPISALSHVSRVYDAQEQTLRIEVGAQAFLKTRLSTRYDSLPPPARPMPGGFLNYDLLVSHADAATQRSGLFELGYFNAAGVGTTSLLAEQLGSSTHVTRLETTWTLDNPEKLRTLHLGDAINAAGSWGRSVRFGGIQYGRNFATQPGLVTFPSQGIAGQAVIPSTVDVFINNALVSRQNVAPGPFSISNLPLVTGAGEVQLVVRDLLGREQIITQPFYASQALLRAGLTSYSYEFGLVRENYGQASNAYGGWLGSGTYRRGLTDNLTGEGHAEAMQGQATAGAGGDWLVPQVGTVSAYAAASHGPAGSGGLMLMGVERQAQPWSLGARGQWASGGFAQVGQGPGLRPSIYSGSLNLSYAAGRAGSVGLAYVGQHNRDQADTRIATLSYSVSLGHIGSLSLSALRNLSGDLSTTLFALLSIPLNTSTSLSVSSQSVRGANAGSRNDSSTTVQRNLPQGEGYGYRIQAGSGGADEASLALQNNYGSYALEAAQTQGTVATRVSASGGVAILGGEAFASRRIDQSFAVVRMPDFPDVHLLADNQAAGRTDANGNALIPRLRAYDVNVISIDQRDLPMNAQIGALKAEAVPYFRSGMAVEFPIKRSQGATFTVRQEDGALLPVGALVQESGTATVYPVGYDGEVYVTGLGPSTRLRATWGSRSCEFVVSFKPSADPLPDLGLFICKDVNP